MPSGSVLSMKWTFIGSLLGLPEGVGHEHRAEGRTADADGQDMGELRGPSGVRIVPSCTAPANRLISARVLRISAAIAGDGAKSGRGASNARPCGSRPDWRWPHVPAQSIASKARCMGAAIRSRKPSSNRIRLTSSVKPSEGTWHKILLIPFPQIRCTHGNSYHLAVDGRILDAADLGHVGRLRAVSPR